MATAESLSQLGKYRIIRPLGSGASGTVYLCDQPHSSTLSAVKVLSSSLQEMDPTALRRFQREARAATMLHHPNIVRTYDLDEHAGNPFLVMEYVDGITVDDLLGRGPMPVEQAVCYISQAACGLDYIHRAGMVHRDLKPSNLLVDRQGIVKILDLGLVTFTDDRRDRLTEKVPRILGTLDFMAPEQAERSSGVDIRADIYSLGATLHYMLTGQPPIAGANIAGKLLAMQFHSARSVREYRNDVDEALAQVILRLLSKSPKNRYEEPLEVVAALSPWVRQMAWVPDLAPVEPVAVVTTTEEQGTTETLNIEPPAPASPSINAAIRDLEIPVRTADAAPLPTRSGFLPKFLVWMLLGTLITLAGILGFQFLQQ
jgi:eukaryotic-like serine/threonine-protein kinase